MSNLNLNIHPLSHKLLLLYHLYLMLFQLYILDTTHYLSCNTSCHFVLVLMLKFDHYHTYHQQHYNSHHLILIKILVLIKRKIASSCTPCKKISSNETWKHADYKSHTCFPNLYVCLKDRRNNLPNKQRELCLPASLKKLY